jgi:hypothetical protein
LVRTLFSKHSKALGKLTDESLTGPRTDG